MEFDTPSRFIKDIDPSLLRVDAEDIGGESDRHPFGGSFGSVSPYSKSPWHEGSSRMQNSRPVASQFRADPKPRLVGHREEVANDPFSERFKRTFTAAGGNMRRVSEVVSRSSASSSAPASAAPHPSLSDIREGSVIEHERFGVGEIIKLEGSGENAKATVLFRHTGTKQLLLKFARFKVVK